MAQVAVSKCADSLPLYRQAKAYRRVGVQVDDSTLGDLFHRCGYRPKPITDSGACRSPIPVEADHRFRSKPIAERVSRGT
jgi:transposase